MSSILSIAEELLEKQAGTLQPIGAVLLDQEAGLGEFEELCWQYLHKLPQPFKLGRIKTRIENEVGAFGGWRYEFDSRLFLGNNLQEPVGQLMITLYRKPGGGIDDIFLELEQGQIWYPELRGQGLGRALLEVIKQLGQALGVKAITAIAIYDGRFAWPALGFRFGDYLPDEAAARKFRRRFLKFCELHKLTPPDIRDWDAPHFARFLTDYELTASVGHRMDRQRQSVGFGRAFLLTRAPFFLSYPLEIEASAPTAPELMLVG